jgi:hypothetical protein
MLPGISYTGTTTITNRKKRDYLELLVCSVASNLLLDYRTGEVMKIYGKAMAPLDVLFDGDSRGLRLFLSKVSTLVLVLGVVK